MRQGIIAFLITVVMSGSAWAGTVPNTFTAGTPAKAAEVNANFTHLQNLIDALTTQVAGLAVVPTGTVVAFAGITPPTGWLMCDGSLVSRSTYSALFAVIGTIYGSGDNVSTFNLPDLRGRTVIGDGTTAGITDRAIGTYVGEETHVLQGSEVPSHNHAETLRYTSAYDSSSAGTCYTAGSTPTAYGTIYTGGMANVSSGVAHNNMQPSLVVKYIIKY